MITGTFLKAAQTADGTRYSAGECATLEPIEAFHLTGSGYFSPSTEAQAASAAGAHSDVDAPASLSQDVPKKK